MEASRAATQEDVAEKVSDEGNVSDRLLIQSAAPEEFQARW
jgi:hypothetical protein